jgi:hypothetical protein
METPAEVSSVEDKKEEVLSALKHESLRLLAHKFKLIMAWFKRQSLEVSDVAQDIKIENYKPENPVATIRYCIDKIYFIAAKLLEEATSHPVFSGLKAYTRRIESREGARIPFCIYRIQEMPRPLALLYAHYVALVISFRSRIFNALLASSNMTVRSHIRDTDPNGFGTFDIASLFRRPYQILHTRSNKAAHFIADGVTFKVNRYWISSLLRSIEYTKCPNHESPGITEETSREFILRESKEASFKGIIRGGGRSSPVDRRDKSRAQALACLRTIGALEMSSPVKLYKNLAQSGTLFEQSINGLILTPIFDSLISYGGLFLGGILNAYEGIAVTSAESIDSLLGSYIYGPASGPGINSIRPAYLWSRRDFHSNSPYNYPISEMRWLKQSLVDSETIFKDMTSSHIYRGISHVPSLKRVAPSHSKAVEFFTSKDWLAHSSLPAYSVRNADLVYAYHDRLSLNLPDRREERACGSMKMSYVATNDIDQRIKALGETGLGNQMTDYFTPCNLFEQVFLAENTEEVFGFTTEDIPSDKDIEKIAHWILKNCKYVTSLHIPFLTSMGNIYNRLKGDISISSPKDITASRAMAYLSCLMVDMQKSYFLWKQISPGQILDDTDRSEVKNWTMDAFHGIKACSHPFNDIPLAVDILQSKIHNLHRFINKEGREIIAKKMDELGLLKKGKDSVASSAEVTMAEDQWTTWSGWSQGEDNSGTSSD